MYFGLSIECTPITWIIVVKQILCAFRKIASSPYRGVWINLNYWSVNCSQVVRLIGYYTLKDLITKQYG